MPITHARRTLVVLATGLVLCSSPTLAQERSFGSIEARQWTADPSGGFSVVGGGPNEALDFVSDLGLEEDDALEGRLVFRPSKRTMIRLGFVPELQILGDNVVTRSISFSGQDFTVSQRVVTDFTLEYGRLGFAWQFISASEGRFRLGPLVELKGFRGDLALSAPDAPVLLAESDRYEAAFGAAGLIAELELGDRVELFGEVTEVVTGDEGDVNEVEYGIRVLVLPRLRIVAGARNLEIDIEDADESFKFELDGAFVGAHFRF
jgi:hypothetical protein